MSPWLPSCGGQPGRAYHILVISLGTLDDGDLDQLDAARHPNFSAWLQTSTRFQALPVEAQDGMATTASMWTGLSSAEHGARTLEDGFDPLGPKQTPMAEYLVEHSYNPGAILGAEAFYDPQFGLNQGFPDYQWISAGADQVAFLGSDWIDHHVKQPFFCFVGLHGDVEKPLDDQLVELDTALGVLLSTLGKHGILDSTLVVLTAHRPRTAEQGIPLTIKAPQQKTAQVDSRAIHPYHLPQLILQHAALPVAAVRPNSYLLHPLPAIPSEAAGPTQE